MKLRQGRKNPLNLYFQVGDEPADDDRCLGLIIDPRIAEWLVNHINANDDGSICGLGLILIEGEK